VFINVQSKDEGKIVAGADFLAPSRTIDIKVGMSQGTFTTGYELALDGLVGSVNNATFLNRARGEVMFYGLSGQRASAGDSELTYRFKIRKNPTLPMPVAANITIPGGTDVIGWDIITVTYKVADDPLVEDLKVGAEGCYISRVVELKNFSALGLGV
jgi:hypothetical protein